VDARFAFFAAWGAPAAFGYFVFVRGRNAGLKRRPYRPFVVFVSALFVAFYLLTGPAGARAPMIAAVVAIMILNLFAFTFCDACGAMPRRAWLDRADKCPACGAGRGR
jgi:hypothetical protein